MANRVPDERLSKTVSHALRHAPQVYELELDAEGWVPVDQLLAALREKGGAWRQVDRSALEAMMASASKQRYELVGDRIRAYYGHSVPTRVTREAATPPAQLFHGTSPATWTTVRTTGLRPMSRQYVHLSADRETAMSVGRRKSPSPVLLAVDTAAAMAAGVHFYLGNESIWLADAIPAAFLRGSDDESMT